MSIIMNGKELAQQLAENQKTRVKLLIDKHQHQPSLCVVTVGEDNASSVYVRQKKRACEELGILFHHVVLPNIVDQLGLNHCLLHNRYVCSSDGVILQLPIPKHLDPVKSGEYIPRSQDVDGFGLVNMGALQKGLPDAVEPCTPKGILHMLRAYNVPLDSAHAVIVGRSNIVGKPLAAMLVNANCTVTLCHSHTKNLPEMTRTADILVSAVGKAGFIRADMIKPDAAVVDVGINRKEDGTLCGDVDFDAVKDICGWISPVPGGVGKMTVAMLMENTITAAEKSIGL